MAVASVVPLSQVPDFESPPEPTATTAPNVESQMRHVPQQATATALGHENDDQGKRLGNAIFCIILFGGITSFFFPFVSNPLQISDVVIASALTCGCCCCRAANYNLEPRVKKWAAAMLVALCLLIILQIIAFIIVYTAVDDEVSSTGTISDSTVKLWWHLYCPFLSLIMFSTL